MALNLSIDLDNATFADLANLVEAARTAGISNDAPVRLDETRLHLETSGGALNRSSRSEHDHHRSDTSTGSEAALRFIAQLLGEERRH